MLEKPQSFDAVLISEKATLKDRRRQLFGAEPTDEELAGTLFGICFSGGGIRSATFNLGILQGLASHKMLRFADYLSTVSGGGYIGSWFHGVVQRAPYKALRDAHGNPFYDYESYLAAEDACPGPPSQDPITFLRKYSNYLSPQLGLFSTDTWVIATIWLRNTMLTQLILYLALAAFLLLPLAVGNFAQALEEKIRAWPGSAPLAGAAIFGLIWWTVFRISRNLRPIVDREFSATLLRKAPDNGETVWWTVFRISRNLRPIVDREFSATPLRKAPDNGETVWWTLVAPVWLTAILLTLLITAGQFVPLDPVTRVVTYLALAVLFASGLIHGGFWTCYQDRHKKEWKAWKLLRVLLASLIVVVCAGLTFCLLAADQKLLLFLRTPEQFLPAAVGSGWPVLVGIWPAICVGPFLIVLALAGGVALQVGLMGVDFPDSAREWYSSISAKLIMAGFLWVSWFAIAVLAPIGVVWVFAKVKNLGFAAVAGWLATTAMGVISGKSAETSGRSRNDLSEKESKRSPLELLAQFAPPVALLGILVGIATASLWVVNRASANAALHLNAPQAALLAACIAGLFVLALLLSSRININEFSLNHFYKNRLVRCYLGASHTDARKPNPLTGFDPKDDILLADLVPDKGYLGPFAIVNCTLNLNHGSELAWQERKANSFIFTPNFCGYLPNHSPNGFTKTIHTSQPAGPHIGMAASISGAAASPNQGYHTQPVTAFLLTLFNVRLGWWAGNTRMPGPASTPGPYFALRYLITELLGLTTEDSKYINLSDGGHFENLGLYELARRKCRFIIVGDGEQDESYQFESLGGAIRKIRIDFGHSIDISPKRIFLEEGSSGVHCAVGHISYNDGSTGMLLYLKASLTGDETYDLAQYKKSDPAFPQDSTLDQFFTESKFESYRALGKHLVEKVFHRVAVPNAPSDLASIFDQLKKNWLPPSTAAAGAFTKHADVYSRLIGRLAETDDLRFLDAEVFPGFQGGSRPDPLSPEMRRAKLLITGFFQLMEDVYLDLGLEDDAQLDHPENAGWVRLFCYWSQGKTFNEVWNSAGSIYGLAFQRFYGRLALTCRP